MTNNYYITTDNIYTVDFEKLDADLSAAGKFAIIYLNTQSANALIYCNTNHSYMYQGILLSYFEGHKVVIDDSLPFGMIQID